MIRLDIFIREFGDIYDYVLAKLTVWSIIIQFLSMDILFLAVRLGYLNARHIRTIIQRYRVLISNFSACLYNFLLSCDFHIFFTYLAHCHSVVDMWLKSFYIWMKNESVKDIHWCYTPVLEGLTQRRHSISNIRNQ